ncbi:MAG: 3D-(3,5/4)-trihydroxycyclohexane-1,2-dione acylhydrolase (decyclizing) [Clostridia bacterium]|nr:3D-(3,5/4)-trihydroxycyclohexane-1,2-dione acylhydrolase (decyclizing) [Clostridia bacterium]
MSIRMSAAEAIIKFLDNQYVSLDGEQSKLVDTAFAIFGHGCVLGIGEALSMGDYKIKVVQGKNEQGMAHAAIAYAKQSNRRRIIPCISSIGPGAANMVTAAATATANNIPLLLLVGDTFASRQPDPVLQQIEHTYNPNITTNDAYKAVSRYFDRINRPEQVMSAMLGAMRVLTDAAMTGAVAIAMPQDVQGECYDYPEEFFAKRVHRITRPLPVKEELQEATELIRKSSRPVIIAGGGVRYSEAGEALARFAVDHNIPICETQAGKSAVASSHPLNLGGVGVTGNLAANKIASCADLIIGVGTRFTDFTTGSKELYSGSKVLTLNLSPFHGGKLDALKMTCDAKAGLEILSLALGDYKSGYTTEISEAKDEWSREMIRLSGMGDDGCIEIGSYMPDAISGYKETHGGGMSQTAAIAVVREEIPANAIIVGSAGSLPGDLQRMWTSDEKDSYNVEYGYSCMGYEIAGCLGSKMAAPDKEVYAMTGDGSYLMLHSEMVTALQEGIKINVLLFDNASFGCINNLQMEQGVDSLCTELRYRQEGKPIREGKFMSIDYAMCAAGYGFKTYTARTVEELREALRDCVKQTLPTFIDIKVLPKSMTHGYGGWWHVGCTSNPRSERGEYVLQEREKKLDKARKY